MNLDCDLYVGGRTFKIKTDCKIGLNCKKLYPIDIYAEQLQMEEQLQQTIKEHLTKAEPIVINIDELDEEEESNEDEEL
jgi:hypothetical protein